MRQLHLNEQILDYKTFPESGFAKRNEQMPRLIAEDRRPLSVADLMKRRLEVLSGSEDVKYSWWMDYFDTGDGSVRHSDGRLKIVPDAQYLRSLSPDTELVLGAVPLSDDAYAGLDGEEFTSVQVEKFFNKQLNKKEAKEHPGLLALMCGDKALLGEVVDATLAQVKEKVEQGICDFGGRVIGVYHGSVPESGAAGRFWEVSGIFNMWAASIGGNQRLDKCGRLVGVAQLVKKPTLVQTVNAVLSVSDRHVPEAIRADFDLDLKEELNHLYT